MRGAFRRFAAGCSGGLFAGVLAAFADAARAAHGVPSRALFVAELGLFVPLALALGLAAGFARAAVLPDDWPSPRRALESLRQADAERRLALSLGGAAAVIGALVGLLVVGRVALRLLASPEAPSPSGAALSLATLGIAALVALVACAVA